MTPLPSLIDRLREREDRVLSPFTGWTRHSWALLADDLLLSARRFATPSHAGIRFPGAEGGYGGRVDALEGFARTFLAAGFRVAGEGGADPHGYLEWYARGLASGVDPSSPDRWPRLDEHDQSRVEAASIALVLTMTRPWLWDQLSARVQGHTVDYFSAAIGAAYPPINWLWFQIIVEQFLLSVGVDVPRDELARLVSETDSFEREDGWYSDGGTRAYDHYAGWALHFYPLVWSRLFPDEPIAGERREHYATRAARYLEDAVRLIGADGSPLIQGRSLAYRFATAAPFWAGAAAGVSTPPPGLIRRAASSMVRHFVEHGAPDAEGVLPIGWHGAWEPLAQDYSGPGSPYWASKGLLGLSLPADHPVWTATEQPLPCETEDQAFVVAAPGWLAWSQRSDGIVRLANHGTDHAHAGDVLPEAPLYSRLGYSTATAPVLLPKDEPQEQSITLVDSDGRSSARTGFERVEVAQRESGTLIGASRWRSRVITTTPGTPDHGFSRAGSLQRDGPLLEVISLVRSGWEVRLVHLPEGDDDLRLRVSGWAVPDSSDAPSPRSRIVNLKALPLQGVDRLEDVSPLSSRVVVPWLEASGPLERDGWFGAAIGLGELGPPPRLEAARERDFLVRWNDGTVEAVNAATILGSRDTALRGA